MSIRQGCKYQRDNGNSSDYEMHKSIKVIEKHIFVKDGFMIKKNLFERKTIFITKMDY